MHNNNYDECGTRKLMLIIILFIMHKDIMIFIDSLTRRCD